MGGHLKNFSLLGGVKGKKLDANGGGGQSKKVKVYKRAINMLDHILKIAI